MTAGSEPARVEHRTGLRKGDFARLVVVWLLSSVALAVADALLSGLSAQAAWAYLLATAVAGALGLVFRPALALVAARIGWLAVILAGLVGQAFSSTLRFRSRQGSPPPSGRRSGRRGLSLG